jgi:hypothetical protein
MLSLSDVILSNIADNENQRFTMLPAKVVSVENLSSNIIDVQPSFKQGATVDTSYDFPTIQEVPIQWPSGGGAVMTFPLVVGDEVMLAFSTRSLAEWRTSKQDTVLPQDRSVNDISYPIAIPCVFRDETLEVNTEDVEIRYGDSEFTLLKDGTVEFFNKNGSYKITAEGTHQGITSSTYSMSNGTVELVDILSQVLTEISNSTVNTVIGAQPLINKALITALITQLDTLKES